MLLSKLFRKNAKPGLPQGAIPTGQRIYAIGDVHGRLDLLEALFDEIDRDDARRAPADSHIIFLGDLVDRGPHSAGVVEFARKAAASRPNIRLLLGNHEEVFLKALKGDPKALSFFTRIGGRETILSYGVSEDEYRDADFDELMVLLQSRVPQEHIEFLERFEDMIELGDYAFVHAGVRPGEPLSCQRPSDLRWIRSEFLDHGEPFDKIVVHGHTITEDIEVRHNRIGLDTGAYASGKLTAMGFEGAERWVLSARL